jgi:hypothetical protein
MSDAKFNVGTAPLGILERSLTENIFVANNLAYMNEGDKDGYNVYKHDLSSVLKAFSNNPMEGATNSLQKNNFRRHLTILEVAESFLPSDYHGYWREFQPTGNFQWEALPAQVQSSIENLILGSTAEAVEEVLTNGDSGLKITGLIPQLLSSAYTELQGASPTSKQISDNLAIAYRRHKGSTTAATEITADNIFEILEELIAGQTKSMRKRQNKKFMISNYAADVLKKAQRTKLDYKGVDVTEAGVLRYGGYDLIENPSFANSDIVFASMSGDMKTDAIQLGTSLSSDYNNLEVNRVGNFGRAWGMALTFALDIFVVRPEEVCFYTTKEII